MENNKIFELHNYLDVKGSPKEIIEKIIEDIPNLDDIGFAGYLEKKWLKMTLKRLILDKNGDNQSYSYNVEYEKEIKTSCEEAIKKCEKYLDGKIHIFLFPTFDEFAIEKMNGVNGFCPWTNTIFIFINFTNQWKKYLKEAIIHELAHALSPYSKSDTSIGSWLVLEGLAENFKDFIFPESQSKWTHAISETESQKILAEIKPFFRENNFNKYSEVFFGTGKYPLWTGYTIGYCIVKNYIKKYPNINWNELLRKNPKEILKKINI